MHQHSDLPIPDLPIQRYLEATHVDGATWDTAPIAENPELQQLGMELCCEQCLNRLSLQMNQVVTAYLASVVTPPTAANTTATLPTSFAPDQTLDQPLTTDMTVETSTKILAQLVEEFSQVLPGHQFAIVQPIDAIASCDRPPLQPTATASEPILQISQITVAPNSKLTWAQPAGQTVRWQPGETFTLQTLHHLKAQNPQHIWQIGDETEPVGWLLLHPHMPQTVDTTCTPTLPPSITQLLERGIQQCQVAIHQIHLIHSQHQRQQTLLAQTEELQQTNQLKSEFLANTSHEIRTPLSSILGFTHLLQVQGFSPTNLRHQEYLNIILTSGQHLLALINDILDLSKIEANQLDLQQETVDVANICQMAITLVREKANDKGLQLHLAIAPQVTTLVADPLRLKQMLFNLLSNAIKFTLRGGVGLEVTPAGQFIQFCVWDTGTGISKEQQRLLFRPYSQIANAAVSQEAGTGLGLALTQKLAELHGGDIQVRSELDHGSRFTISLPLISRPNGSDRPLTYPPPSTPSPNEPATAGNTTAPPVITKPRRSARRSAKSPPAKPAPAAPPSCPPPRTPIPSSGILLVEDNIHNAKLMLTFLSKLSYEVTWVQNGLEMWQVLERSRPALILMDIHLPGEDGLSLTRRLSHDERYNTIPIIAQTALAMKGDRDLCLEAGAVDYISKPIDLNALAQLVATYVNRHLDNPPPE